ncbi:AAA family ATPase, partial [Candidatus Bipolaricaulota bacterium]|nr:AAA family ATPase [Candidatus Bipolaricaulota bacterium]
EVAFAPTDLRTKVYIIDEVHMLTNEAFNALLKTLEEPPRHVVFILATTEPHKVPRTIVSRCQAFDFRKIPEEKITSRLAEIAKEEGIAIAPDALALMACRANGGMRDAIVMLEQAISYAGGEITIEPLLDMLGLVGREVNEKFLHAIEDGDRKAVLTTIDSLVKRGKDLEIFLADLVGTVRDRLSQGSETERRDIRLCRGLLDIKQDLFRSLDRRILLEIGLLSLMNDLGEKPSAPLGPPLAIPQEELQVEGKEELFSSVVPEKSKIKPPVDRPVNHGDEGEFSHKWQAMLRAIEQERIAIGAFLAEATPRLSGDRVTIAFHPEYSFHKESLEKSANLQYLAGMVHRHLGDKFYVEIRLDDGVVRAPSPRESLREKAKLICQMFDGTIVKEE